MEGSLITKKVIAYSLKKLMQSIPFQKITIRQIMEVAEIRRQTFYDYFKDKYELLEWIYRQDIAENVQDFLDYEHWTKVKTRMLQYFNNNQVFYLNALAVTEQNSFDHYFFEHTKQLFQTIVQDIMRKQDLDLANDQVEFICRFYSYGFVGIVKEWLVEGCKESVEELSDSLDLLLETSTLANLARC